MERTSYFSCLFFRFGIFNPSIVYDNLGEIFSALIFGSLVFCVFLYIKVRISNQQSFPVCIYFALTLSGFIYLFIFNLEGSFGSIIY
jgi:1,4-dihydroxy-2-naphthoate octaprenyltransferase